MCLYSSYAVARCHSIASWRFFPCVRLRNMINFEYFNTISGDRRVLVGRVFSARRYIMRVESITPNYENTKRLLETKKEQQGNDSRARRKQPSSHICWT